MTCYRCDGNRCKACIHPLKRNGTTLKQRVIARVIGSIIGTILGLSLAYYFFG